MNFEIVCVCVFFFKIFISFCGFCYLVIFLGPETDKGSYTF